MNYAIQINRNGIKNMAGNSGRIALKSKEEAEELVNIINNDAKSAGSSMRAKSIEMIDGMKYISVSIDKGVKKRTEFTYNSNRGY